MQKVFENIITNLENEVLKSRGNLTRTYAFEKATEIVKQAVKEYNDGWIPCSKQMPEEMGWYLVSREDGTVNTSFCFEEKEWREGHNSKILAWQPLLKSYQPKGE